MKVFRKLILFGSFISAMSCEMALAQSGSPPTGVGAPRSIAEKTVDALPQGPLYWSVKPFPSLEQAQKAAGDFGLAAESDGKAWLFTLGLKNQAVKGEAAAIEAGPITPPAASRFLLRVSESITSPGRVTPVHTHPGSEAFYVLKGEIEYKTATRTDKVTAGNASAGPPPNTVMQATTTGTETAHNLVMFVLDATKPPQAAASF